MALFKAGIIGCGGRGRGHAEGYQASPDVEIVACADPFEEARGNLRSSLKLREPMKITVRCWIKNRSILSASAHGLRCTKRWLSQRRIVGLKPSTPRNRWHRHGATPKHSIKRV